jgi:aminopeptidase N
MLGVVACGTTADSGQGVSWQLARQRAARISRIHYVLHFDIPEQLDAKVRGRVDVAFDLSDAGTPVVLDFDPQDGAVKEVVINGAPAAVGWDAGHIELPSTALAVGPNTVHVAFVAGNGALNRNPDYLYTLFVPDRASSAFPSFDQPNLKATYELSLSLPASWAALANGAMTSDSTADGRRFVSFAETQPLPTYLSAFVVGRFRVDSSVRGTRTLRLFHRESDTARIVQNVDAIFDLHETAIAWMEDYTGIPYPFGKFDVVAIPAFQYRGMEHPGAILYRSSALFLDEAPTQDQRLARASVIAHETAHMWFGNLVTMAWFNDVWMKEVFANFMAAKIVNPSFPTINHDLRFFLAHHPAAYGVDRTEGTNAIRQSLDNLSEAGSLYGAIIYQKAPVVMRQLERMTGETTMRDGLREYLLAHQFGNATWRDLIAILDRLVDIDLTRWSDVWVETRGRPEIEVLHTGDRRFLANVRLRQSDPVGRRVTWLQDIDLALGSTTDSARHVRVRLDRESVELKALNGIPTPEWIVAGADGVGYGHFRLDRHSRETLVQELPAVADPVIRAVAWMGLWEAMLARELPARQLLEAGLRVLPHEPDDLIAQRVLRDVGDAFWRYLDNDSRSDVAPDVEAALWRALRAAGHTPGRRAAIFDAYVSIATTATAVGHLEALWQANITIPDLPMTERRRTQLALELAVRDVEGAHDILGQQLSSIANADRNAQFGFVMPALDPDSTVRDSVFQSFADPANREHEPWVLEALSYLNHPLRARSSEHFLLPGLQLVEELERTGDIFFPLDWLNALFSGHRSRTAAAAVRRFLSERPRYPARLKGKILQAADPLFRASGVR